MNHVGPDFERAGSVVSPTAATSTATVAYCACGWRSVWLADTYGSRKAAEFAGVAASSHRCPEPVGETDR